MSLTELVTAQTVIVVVAMAVVVARLTLLMATMPTTNQWTHMVMGVTVTVGGDVIVVDAVASAAFVATRMTVTM